MRAGQIPYIDSSFGLWYSPSAGPAASTAPGRVECDGRDPDPCWDRHDGHRLTPGARRAAKGRRIMASTKENGAVEIKLEDKSKRQALANALAQIDKAFGRGSIMRLDEEAYLAVPGISTGALSLDLALGGRGIPRGRIIEVFGPESSGKTTLALSVAANAQRAGGVAAFIDAEHALDPSWAKRIGVNIDELLVSQPDTGEQALEICELLVRSNAVDVIVVDSVAALIPKAEIEGEMGDAHVGLQARLMSQAMRKLTGVIARSNCTVIFINQIREKIGVMFGSPETTPGGRALKFYASVRIDIRRTSAIKDGETNVGNRVRAKVVKNKVAPPFRDAEFDIMFNEGISMAGDLLDLAVEEKVVQKSGAWFAYGDVRLGQGRENAKQFIKDNPDLAAEIREAVLNARLPGRKHVGAAVVSAAPDLEEVEA
ncbi:MAG: protein RecA [Phycisphaerales bacterium]|nr:MAG: protein RecA [Planctomycetota bacterium]